MSLGGAAIGAQFARQPPEALRTAAHVSFRPSRLSVLASHMDSTHSVRACRCCCRDASPGAVVPLSAGQRGCRSHTTRRAQGCRSHTTRRARGAGVILLGARGGVGVILPGARGDARLARAREVCAGPPKASFHIETEGIQSCQCCWTAPSRRRRVQLVVQAAARQVSWVSASRGLLGVVTCRRGTCARLVEARPRQVPGKGHHRPTRLAAPPDIYRKDR